MRNRKTGAYKYTDEFILKEAEALTEYLTTTTLPFLQEFCGQRGYSSQRISDWTAKVPEFAEAVAMFKDKQLINLVQGALNKKIDTAMAIFTLKNVAGWRDKTELEHSGEIRHKTFVYLDPKAVEEFNAQKEGKIGTGQNPPQLSTEQV